MAMYKVCPDCGAHLDPGEVCDCHEIELERLRKVRKRQAEATFLAEREGMWEQQALAI